MDNRHGAGLSEYVLSQHAAPDLERARLVLLQEFYGALSARQLDAIGVAPGWRCLDVARHDLLSNPLPADTFDLVHARLLLMFLPHAAGLVDVHCECSSGRAPGGSLLGRLLSLTLERLPRQMLALGADADEIDDARRLLEDPTSRVDSPNSCFARGRRAG
jgi:hypothetical protein